MDEEDPVVRYEEAYKRLGMYAEGVRSRIEGL